MIRQRPPQYFRRARFTLSGLGVSPAPENIATAKPPSQSGTQSSMASVLQQMKMQAVDLNTQSPQQSTLKRRDDLEITKTSWKKLRTEGIYTIYVREIISTKWGWGKGVRKIEKRTSEKQYIAMLGPNPPPKSPLSLRVRSTPEKAVSMAVQLDAQMGQPPQPGAEPAPGPSIILPPPTEDEQADMRKPPPEQETEQEPEAEKSGMSTNAKIGLGVGAAAAAYFLFMRG